jgi:iron complex outermembrane receptor protein
LAFAAFGVLQFAVRQAAIAADPVQLAPLQVTATRMPEPTDRVPANITVIEGDELRARGVTDLRTALSLVAGVEAPPGGDTGPAGAVPSFWGLHEFDAFLLVVDGVPWGGAFNPSIPTLNLHNVERIEVLKGPAPVLFGATSFVGVIQVIHYPAGQSTNDAEVSYGSYGSGGVSASSSLPAIGEYEQSLEFNAEKLGFSDARETIKGGNVLYRGAGPFADGLFRVDANIALQRQVPPSPVVRQDTALTTLTPLDANYNPADARINENRYNLVLGYARPTALGQWDTTISWAQSYITDIRGFLRRDLIDDGTPNADSQNQSRKILDMYFDTHVSTVASEHLSLVYGVDVLYGVAKQSSSNGEYYVPLSGGIIPPSTSDLHVDEVNSITDKRAFFGEYAQIDYKPDPRWNLVAGLRLNQTWEQKSSSHVDGFDPTANESADATKYTNRPSGTIGLSYRAWQSGSDEAVFYGDYRNAFKPAAIDFGPDFTPDILNPETAQSYELGVKGRLADGRLTYQVSTFLLNFQNLVLQTTDEQGNPIFQNAGGERMKGAELQTLYRASSDLSFSLNLSYHDAYFTKGLATEGGANVALEGKRLTLSPRLLSSLGFVYAPRQGFNATVVANYVGSRYLDLANTAVVGSYTTIDAGIGYRYERFSIILNAYNLTDRRPPVTQSEFGDSSYYLMPARTVFVRAGISL